MKFTVIFLSIALVLASLSQAEAKFNFKEFANKLFSKTLPNLSKMGHFNFKDPKSYANAAKAIASDMHVLKNKLSSGVHFKKIEADMHNALKPANAKA